MSPSPTFSTFPATLIAGVVRRLRRRRSVLGGGVRRHGLFFHRSGNLGHGQVRRGRGSLVGGGRRPKVVIAGRRGLRDGKIVIARAQRIESIQNGRGTAIGALGRLIKNGGGAPVGLAEDRQPDGRDH